MYKETVGCCLTNFQNRQYVPLLLLAKYELHSVISQVKHILLQLGLNPNPNYKGFVVLIFYRMVNRAGRIYPMKTNTQ